MFRGFLSTWVGLIINGVVSFLLVRVLVHGLGDFYYGLWILASYFLDFYGLLDMGMRYSLQRFVARYGGTNQREALNETFMTGISMTVLTGATVIVICAVLIWILPGFFHVSGESRTVFRIVLVIQSLTLALNLPARIMGAYLCGLHRFDLYNGAASLQGVLRGVVFWIVIRMGGRIIGVAVAYLVIMAVILVLVMFFVRLADPELSVGWKYTSFARTKELVQFSAFVFLNDIGDRLRFSTDAIVISHFLSVALSTPFNVISKLMETFKMVFFPITGPLNTEANLLDGQKKVDAVKALFLRSTKVCALLAFAGTTVLVLYGRDILRFWMGGAFSVYFNLLVVLTIGYCVILMQSPTPVFLYVRSRQKTMAAWTLAEGLVNLGLSIYWARQYGILGVALGTTVPMLIVRLGIQPFYTLRVLDLSWGEYLVKSYLRPAMVTAVAIALAFAGGLVRHPATKLSFAAVLVVLGSVFFVLSYWIVFDDRERERLRHHGALLVRRLRLQHV
jgi:O-antigen/teichoic acid export membrane protein